MAEFDIGAWKRMQAQIASSQKRVAAQNKKNSRSHGGGGGGRRARGGARATRGASAGSGRPAPQLLLKIHGGSLASVDYMRRQENAQHIDSNMLSQETKDLLAEFHLDTARHPRVDPKNLFVHVSLSRPAGGDLTPAQWQKVVRKFLKTIAADGCQYIATRHPGQHDHLHLVFSRSKPDGTLVSMSNNRWAWRAATRQVEAEMGFTEQPAQSDSDVHTSTSDTQVNASRRSQRLGTVDPWIDGSLINAALANASSMDEFKSRLHSSGLQVQMAEKNGRITGIVFKKQDASHEWLAGSSVSRQFSLQKIQARIELNQQCAQEMALMLMQRRQQQAAQAQAQQAQNRQRRGG